MAQIITRTDIPQMLSHTHLFVDISKTHVELGKIIGRERHIVGRYCRRLLSENPELLNEFIYQNSEGEKLMTKRLSPYMCWLLHRYFVVVRITGLSKSATEYYNSRRDLFSKDSYNAAKKEAVESNG